MSAITKLHTRKNKNSFWQHSSCPVQTQDYQTSLKTRNIFCLALKLTGQGEAAAPQLRTEPAPVVPVNAPLAPAARGIAAHTWCHKAQQSLDVVYSRKMGLLLPADHRGCCQELPQLSMDHFTGVTGKSNYKVSVFAELIEIPILSFFLTQVFLTVLYIINIFIITHVQKILHCCKTSPEQIQEISGENSSIQASWGLPGFVSSPVGTLTRQWLKSPSSYVSIIKCPFLELENRDVPELGKM